MDTLCSHSLAWAVCVCAQKRRRGKRAAVARNREREREREREGRRWQRRRESEQQIKGERKETTGEEKRERKPDIWGATAVTASARLRCHPRSAFQSSNWHLCFTDRRNAPFCLTDAAAQGHLSRKHICTHVIYRVRPELHSVKPVTASSSGIPVLMLS